MRIVISLAILALLVSAGTPVLAESYQALGGNDPVALVQGEEVAGKADLTAEHEGFAYHFASEENKAAFEEDPSKYEIQGDGMCTVMPRVPANPGLYTVHNEKIYIFGSKNCLSSFLEEPEAFVEE